MTQREKNRIREHRSHDFNVDEANAKVPGEKLIHCNCGWVGWLSFEAVKKLEEAREIWLSGN